LDGGKSRLPLRKLTCKKCGCEFLTAITVLLQNKGQVTCANCGKCSFYVPSDLKDMN
jgi:transcription elongation factor Elf1